MGKSAEVQDLIARVRDGDPDAAAQLVRDYEPCVRRAIRMQLRDPRLRATVDKADICQSVMASFFARLALGQYDLERPGQLAALLAQMARSKAATRARRSEVTRRDLQGQAAHAFAFRTAPAPGPDPSRLIAARDLLEQFRLRLRQDERALADRRAEGRSWAEISAEAGSTPDALRKKLARALDRIAVELGLDDLSDF